MAGFDPGVFRRGVEPGIIHTSRFRVPNFGVDRLGWRPKQARVLTQSPSPRGGHHDGVKISLSPAVMGEHFFYFRSRLRQGKGTDFHGKREFWNA
jgi:hypothetical protein